MQVEKFKPKLWSVGDLNAFFGLFTNILVNTLVLTGLCLYVVKIPEVNVYSRILPALGIALLIGNLFYTYIAYQKAKVEKRNTVTALPYGPSVPQMFIVVFMVMLPTYISTGNPILSWILGMVWALLVGCIVLLGAFIGPTIRKYTPRAAMLGALAGVSITFIAMRPGFLMYETPWIGLICFMIILISWMGRVRLPFGIPGGLAVIIIGSALAWGATFFGFSNMMDLSKVGGSFNHFGVYLPILTADVLSLPMAQVWPLLVTAVPLGIYNFTEVINNVESASAAGDNYNLRAVLIADGMGAIAGAFLGSPFPPAVYVGHPGWKAVGGCVGYSLATGIGISLVCFLGLTAVFLSIIPLVAIIPILLFIGLIIGAQAFQETPKRHAPAIILAFIPNIAEWANSQMNSVINATGVDKTLQFTEQLRGSGVLLNGMATLGSGAVLAGLMLAAIAVFVIDRRFNWAAVFAFIASMLSFFGFIHGHKLAFNATPAVSLAYFIVGLMFCLLTWQQIRKGEKISWEPVSNQEESISA
ncbi:hypothetical protein [Serratia sp. DD3]|uniref:hypothetical protein n=1 Tax=Serratia sp. DD3 TaxID=1410619 RepID=UPI0004D82BB5|nr:hypothetical protein [Serratia sp. DD3]KEY59220.1 permease [Serratia sp. DD3]